MIRGQFNRAEAIQPYQNIIGAKTCPWFPSMKISDMNSYKKKRVDFIWVESLYNDLLPWRGYKASLIWPLESFIVMPGDEGAMRWYITMMGVQCMCWYLLWAHNNLQAHTYRCTFYPRVFQGILSIANMCALSKNMIFPRITTKR